MSRKKYPTEQTKCIDDCICPYCGHKWSGREATNGNMDATYIECPSCNRGMEVFLSIKYLCTAIDE